MAADEELAARQRRAMDAYLAGKARETVSQTRPAPGWYEDKRMVGTRRYWDGARWTDHVAPIEVPVSGTTATVRDDSTWAWLLAALPLLWLPFDYFAPEFSGKGWVVVGGILLSMGLAAADANRIEDRLRIHVNDAWAMFLVPVYLISRTRRVGSTPLIPALWIFGAAISVLGAFTFAASYEFGRASDEWGMEQKMKDRGLKRVDVSCPDTQVRSGDVVWCTADIGLLTRSIRVDIQGDSYSWRMQ